MAVVPGDTGIAVAPFRDGVVIEAEEFRALPEDEREKLQAEMEHVGGELQELLRRFHDWGREHYEAVRALDREMAAATARRILDDLRKSYSGFPAVLEHLAQVELDVVDSAGEFLQSGPEGIEATLRHALRREGADGPSFRRYRINVLVDRSEQQGAPVVYEDNPTYANLMGRIRRNVVEAVEAGSFEVHAIETADDAMELLTGKPAGARDGAGKFPDGSINERVEARLASFAESSREFLLWTARDRRSRPPR